MSEERKKKRIARIGNISSVQGTAKGHSDDGLAQVDCNLVYDIMQSMDKSQIMSYQQLQEFRSKDNCISRTNTEQNSSKQISRLLSKQIKKGDGKTFPLMAKCQKSMKYLKKNRCIPKPRAHVGFIPRPPQKTVSNLKPQNHSVVNTRSHNESSLKIKRNSKKSRRSPEMNGKLKTPKISQSLVNSCDKNNAKLISNAETDSDNEFEQFLQKHHPAKCTLLSSDCSSDSGVSPRKIKKTNKTKRKERKKIVYRAKLCESKMTRKTLTESEESDESQVEYDGNNKKKCIIGEDSSNRRFSSRRFQRIIEYENSDDSVSDTYVNDSSTLNYDSCNSDVENNLDTKLSNNENVIHVINNSERLDKISAEPSSVASSSTSLSELKDTPCCDILKLKCKIRCSVSIERNLFLEQKVASLRTENSSVVPVPNLYDDDDCIIINDNSENARLPIENRNSLQGECTGILKSATVSEILTDRNDEQNKHMHSEKVFNSNGRQNVAIPSKFLSDSGDHGRKGYSPKNINSPEYEEKNSLNYEKSISAENETFNVQILSVKSLNESGVIVSLDDEEKDMEIVPIVNETNVTVADDSDVEIICIDSRVVKEEKSVNENIKVDSNGGTHKVNIGINENASSCTVQLSDLNEEDCIILNVVDNSSKNPCNAKDIGQVKLTSQLNVKAVDICNERTNSSINDITPGLDKDSILKTLETIDFNCINKILNKTTTTDTQIDKNSNSDSVKADNSADNDLFPEMQKTIDAYAFQQTTMDPNITCAGSSEVNKIICVKIPPVGTREEHIKLVENSNGLHNVIKNVTSAGKLDNAPTNINCNESSAFCNSNANLSAPKLSVCGKEIIASSHKTEQNTLLHSQKNQLQLQYTKMENDEKSSDKLDILAAKSLENLNEKQKKTIMPLVDLYNQEYRKFMEIKSTEKNVTAGLKLLEEKQAMKLMRITSSIKNVAKNDPCFHKVKNEHKSSSKSSLVKTGESLDEIKKPSNINWPDIKKDDKVKIFNPSVVEGASEILRPTSSQEVYSHLMNSVCAECGKQAMAACSGCAKVFFCSIKCGMSYWDKGHCSTCRDSSTT